MVLAWIVSAIAQKLPLQLCSDDEPKANRPHLGYDAARDETGLLLIYAGTRLPSFFKQSHDEPDPDGVRNRSIRQMGFDQDSPYPKDWSDTFHDRETQLFKVFTVAWTLLLAASYLAKLITSRPL